MGRQPITEHNAYTFPRTDAEASTDRFLGSGWKPDNRNEIYTDTGRTGETQRVTLAQDRTLKLRDGNTTHCTIMPPI